MHLSGSSDGDGTLNTSPALMGRIMRDAAKKPVKPIIIYMNSESHQPTRVGSRKGNKSRSVKGYAIPLSKKRGI